MLPDNNLSRELSSPALSGDHELILVVEDDRWVRHFLRELLEVTGYCVIEAQDAMEALEKYRQQGDAIALVLCDLVIPKMSGRELCRELKNARQDLKVLFMSGYPIEVIRERGIAVDDIALLPKPFNPEELLNGIRAVLLGGTISGPFA